MKHSWLCWIYYMNACFDFFHSSSQTFRFNWKQKLFLIPLFLFISIGRTTQRWCYTKSIRLPLMCHMWLTIWVPLCEISSILCHLLSFGWMKSPQLSTAGCYRSVLNVEFLCRIWRLFHNKTSPPSDYQETSMTSDLEHWITALYSITIIYFQTWAVKETSKGSTQHDKTPSCLKFHRIEARDITNSLPGFIDGIP